MRIRKTFHRDNDATLFHGDCLDLLKRIPDKTVQLVITSPPYNIEKEYETRKTLDEYLRFQESVIAECVRVLSPGGSICWQVGNYIAPKGEIVPLDMALFPLFASHRETGGLRLRNRVIWHFEHGLHCTKRLSHRYETLLWFTKGDNYRFNVDPIRVPQKYPGKKAYQGPRKGRFSGNPLGKNPGDVWTFPNVKSNHREKTSHPCQFPIELPERLILACTCKNDLVLDPFLGVGTTIVAAVLHGRKGVGADIHSDYLDIARNRIKKAMRGTLPRRPRNTPTHVPNENTSLLITPSHFRHHDPARK